MRPPVGSGRPRVGALPGGGQAPGPAGPSAAAADPAHLLLRTTYGLTPGLLAEATAAGPSGWIEQQLDPAGIDDRVCDELVGRFDWLDRSAAEVRAGMSEGDWKAMNDLTQAALARACWSRRQLFEVMVDLWGNHLNVTCPSSEVWDVRAVDDRVVYRAHALGRFSDMLVASAQSPSMLRYLNGDSSTKTRPNENYGRELLELHTVGVGAGYTETEVRQSALVFTGMTVDDASGTFRYRAQDHHVGPLSVLGWSSPNSSADGGVAVAESYLRYLAVHPLTARRIATRLAVRFVSDSPPAALVERLAATYLAQDTQIKPVLRQLFASPEFAASAGQKTRRPVEDLTAVVRGLGIEPPLVGKDPIGSLHWMSYERGQAPLGWHPPDGYPDVAVAWQGAGTTLTMWEQQLTLAGGWWPEQLQHPGAASLLPTPRPTTNGALVDALSRRLLNRTLPPTERTCLLAFVGAENAAPTDQTLGWRLPWLVSLVFATPSWTQR